MNPVQLARSRICRAIASGALPRTVLFSVVVTLVAACVLLAPSIVLGYAVKAAEREDRERGL